MKVTEHIANAKGNTLFSIEVLPPQKGKTIDDLLHVIEPLMEFKPPFIDVTYHREETIYKKRADGLIEEIPLRKRPGTVGICAAIMNHYDVDAVPHIICGGFTKEETETALIDLQFLGIDNVLALRADWTRYDPAITQALADLERTGIPVYAVYRQGKPPVVLSELISVADVLAALK